MKTPLCAVQIQTRNSTKPKTTHWHTFEDATNKRIRHSSAARWLSLCQVHGARLAGVHCAAWRPGFWGKWYDQTIIAGAGVSLIAQSYTTNRGTRSPLPPYFIPCRPAYEPLPVFTLTWSRCVSGCAFRALNLTHAFLLSLHTLARGPDVASPNLNCRGEMIHTATWAENRWDKSAAALVWLLLE